MATFLSKIECPDCDEFLSLIEADENESCLTYLECQKQDCQKRVDFLPLYCRWRPDELLDADETMLVLDF